MPSGFHLTRPVRRFSQLFAGLLLYGFSMALMIKATLGLDPWDVFHQGLSERTGLRFGLIVNLVGVVVLLLWIPLRQRPGIGTILNIIVIGPVADLSLALLPEPTGWPPRVLFLLTSVVLNGLATGAYIGANLGSGPRDGLMTGLARGRWSIRLVRTAIELVVLIIGFILGGTVGVGTVLYALTIGPLSQFFLSLLTMSAPPGDSTQTEPTGDRRTGHTATPSSSET